MSINVADVPQAAGRPYLAKAVRSLRVISIEKRVSAAKNDMLSYELEFCYPDSEKTPTGETVKLAGMSFRGQIVFHGKNDMPLKELKALVLACKANPQVDLENPAFLKENFLGKGIRAEIRTETSTLTQTDESGIISPVLDDSGAPIVDNNYKVGRFIGSDERYTVPSSAMPAF